MINTILLDLDGTLLQFSQDEFIATYFTKIKKVFTNRGLDADESVKAVWAGTKAMVVNDGSKINAERFWAAFSKQLALNDEQRQDIEAACEDFYTNEFDSVKSILTPSDIPERLVRALPAKGYTVVLATNPLFPPCAVTTRLGWAGLTQQDFFYVSHYENSSFSKPNPQYYEEIFAKIGREPKQCLMAGNNAVEDMVAAKLGAEVFLVTNSLENDTAVDISSYRQGTLAELEVYLMSLPNID
ncbi:MAG: HAD family hydrolase [Coriobacteriia bacterium]|nr:HAD family hydrolase [Coriobacteriia bacterium]